MEEARMSTNIVGPGGTLAESGPHTTVAPTNHGIHVADENVVSADFETSNVNHVIDRVLPPAAA